MILRLILLSLVISTSLQAVTIHWGNALFDSLLESDGTTALGDTEYTFQIGYFDGLTPDATNIDQWQSSYQVFDAASFSNSTSYFTGSATLSGTQTSDSSAADPSTAFPVGSQAYIWISNGGAADDPNTEWSLVTNSNWLFPDGQHDQTEWRLSDDGTVAVFGSVEGVDGLGEMIDPSGSPATIQTGTFPIPEPSSAWLMMVGLSTLIISRRRKPMS